jgi:hypothetical protein
MVVVRLRRCCSFYALITKRVSSVFETLLLVLRAYNKEESLSLITQGLNKSTVDINSTSRRRFVKEELERERILVGTCVCVCASVSLFAGQRVQSREIMRVFSRE